MTGFQKDLSHLTWDEVFARQEQRAFLVPDWMEALRLNAGDHALDLGAGPGYVSLRMAMRVGPTGLVYAVDRAPDAIASLQERRRRDDVTNVRCVVADVLHFSLEDDEKRKISAVLLAMMLHHTDDPAALIGQLARLLPADARAVIAEFHPDGPAQSGPPRDARVAPARIHAWLQQANLRVLDYTRQSEEHYMLIVQQ
ncbi:MAG TPA: methyltransferase domain-containing protein [Ktedonobacterales bacterium]|nr:methyltransferase domain-containing protein [Ktedonobacterales bacterium]